MGSAAVLAAPAFACLACVFLFAAGFRATATAAGAFGAEPDATAGTDAAGATVRTAASIVVGGGEMAGAAADMAGGDDCAVTGKADGVPLYSKSVKPKPLPAKATRPARNHAHGWGLSDLSGGAWRFLA